MAFQLTSTAFSNGEQVPPEHTCTGQDRSPQLAWREAPAGARSFALIVEDPDAPRGEWTHWVLYDLPPDVQELPAGMPANATLPDGARQGRNDSGKIGYSGPCPPPGPAHRYFFRLSALDSLLNLRPGASKQEVTAAMAGHVLGQAELMGRYAR